MLYGQEIYENFVNIDVLGLTTGADETLRIAASYQGRAIELQQLAVDAAPDWQGAAADAARRGGQPVVVEHEIAVPHIGSAATSMQLQAGAMQTAKNSVVPVPDVPAKPGIWDNLITAGSAGRHYEQQMVAIQQANDHNIAVMTEYEAATERNAALLTSVPTVPNGTAPDGTPVPPQPLNAAPVPRRGQATGGGQSGATAHPAAPAPQPSTQGSPTRTAPSGTTPVGRTRPAAALAPPSGLSEVDAPRPAPTGPQPGGTPAPLVGGYGAGADPGRGARGFGAGGPGGPSEPGPNTGRPGDRGGGLGARGGAGAEGAAARGAAGTPRGGPNSGGQPMGQGGRGKGGEDLERERPSFLVEPDPDETFGTDEVTAPPVIGG